MSLKQVISRSAVKAGLYVSKNSPTILTAAGVVGGVASTVLTARATLQVPPVMNNFRANKVQVRASAENKRQLGKDMTAVHLHLAKDLTRIYGVPVGVGVVSVACVLSAHNILAKRNAAAVGALALVESAFGDYRERVIEDLGAEKDREYRFGKTKQVKGKDVEGRDVVATEGLDEKRAAKDLYSAFFDESNVNWSPHADYNLVFLRANERWANDRLYARGHVFLNEVFDQLGLPHTQVGAVTGWVLNSGPDGDNKIEFGLDADRPAMHLFREGREAALLLEFNVDGTIVHKI